ncbi:hypothetical protein M8C21_015519, partial [Ambrosia artemisiifolia]
MVSGVIQSGLIKQRVAVPFKAAMCSGDNDNFVVGKEHKGIVSAVQLLDPSIPNLDKKYVVSILMPFMAADRLLNQLVEMEVEGAKKLQETIGHGKLWGVFAR